MKRVAVAVMASIGIAVGIGLLLWWMPVERMARVTPRERFDFLAKIIIVAFWVVCPLACILAYEPRTPDEEHPS